MFLSRGQDYIILLCVAVVFSSIFPDFSTNCVAIYISSIKNLFLKNC